MPGFPFMALAKHTMSTPPTCPALFLNMYLLLKVCCFPCLLSNNYGNDNLNSSKYLVCKNLSYHYF